MAKQTNRGKPKQIDLAVLETAEWFERDRIMTVRPLFQQLMQVAAWDSNEFHYATFTGPESFQETLKDLVSKDGVEYVYICTHGKKDEIQFPFNRNKKKINVATFDCFDKSTLRGVFLGGCELAGLAEDIAVRWHQKKLRGETKGNYSPWFAGYTEEVKWIHGAWLDMMFLGYMFSSGRSRSDVTDNLLEFYEDGFGGLMETFGFSIFMNGKKIDIYEDDEA